MEPSHTKDSGFSTLEAMLSVALIGILAVPVAGAVIASEESMADHALITRAFARGEEGIEAVRNIKEKDFKALTDGDWGLTLKNGAWALAMEPDTADGFVRTITIAPQDKSSKIIQSTISWTRFRERLASTTIATVVSDWSASKKK